MDKLRSVIKNIPIPCRVIFCMFPAAVILHLLFIISADFAEAYCVTGGALFRTILAWITSPFPFSVAESVLIFVPFILIAVTVYIIRADAEASASVRLIAWLVSVLTLIYSLFVLTFAAGFYTRDIGDFYGLEQRDITVDELCEAAFMTAEGANEAYALIEGKSLSSTTMGMTYGEMNDRLLEAFDSLYGKYSYPSKLTSRVKPVVLSEPMTHTHISGIYTFFTGEANINVNYPDFVIPYTAAHELSHQRGVSRENEANFVAFLVCLESDDPYIRYSGYLNMYQYMASAVYTADPGLYSELYYTLDEGIRRELAAYSDFFDKYRDSTAAAISGKVNDTYLNIMSGTDSRSYGMVVDLATLYLIGE